MLAPFYLVWEQRSHTSLFALHAWSQPTFCRGWRRRFDGIIGSALRCPHFVQPGQLVTNSANCWLIPGHITAELVLSRCLETA